MSNLSLIVELQIPFMMKDVNFPIHTQPFELTLNHFIAENKRKIWEF